MSRSRPVPRLSMAWLRRRLGRRGYLAVVAAIAITAGTMAARITGEAATAAAQWGPGRPVPVATRDLAPGTELSSGDIEMVTLPTALLPRAEPATDAVGRRLAHPLAAGEVVLALRLAPPAASEVAARLPAGTVGVAVPHDGRGLRLVLGDRVDVLATFEAGANDGRDPTFPVARSATVVDVGEEGVTVAVPSADAPRVAFALAAGVVTLTLVP